MRFIFNHQKEKYYAYAWMILGISFIFKLYYSTTFPIIPDEANYWQWSRYLDWGYYDQAPMIAWLIKFFTIFFNHTEFAVRLPSVTASFISSIYIVLICKRYFNSRTAFHSMIVMNSILIFNAGGILATADAIQALGWIGATYHILRAYDENRLIDWIFGGLWFGFGMLSKYSAVLFGLFAFIYGLSSKEKRELLLSYKPYLGASLSVIVFIPVLYWNMQNEWASARHVLYIGGGKTKELINLKYFFEYLGAQAGIVSPVIFVFVCLAWLKSIRDDKWFFKYFFFTSALMFLFFGFLSLHSRIYANWPAPCYAMGVLLAAFYYSDSHEKFLNIQKRYIWYFGVFFSFIVSSLLLIQLNFKILPLSADADRISREISGWKEAGLEIEKIMDSMPDKENAFYFALKYQTASELAFYTPGNPYPVCINRWSRPNVYDFWFFDEDFIGKDGVGMILSEHKLNRLTQVFEKVDKPHIIKVYRDDLFIRNIYLVKCHRFKGGLRWQPKEGSDIRYQGPKSKK